MRSNNDSMMGGVCGGLAEVFGWSPTRLRVIWVLATIFTAFAGAVVYIALWFLMPKAPLGYEPAAEQSWRRAT